MNDPPASPACTDLIPESSVGRPVAQCVGSWDARERLVRDRPICRPNHWRGNERSPEPTGLEGPRSLRVS
jgi:hypothetical protein